MPSISVDFQSKWNNYHRTSEGRYVAPGQSESDGEIREIAHVHCADLVGSTGPEMFGATAKVLQEFIAEKKDARIEAGEIEIAAPEACELAGRGWSFTKLVGAKDLQIDLTGLAGISEAHETQLHKECKHGADSVAFVSGGTRLREIVEWARAGNRGKSISTSGTHLGPTIAGGFGTASHGSRLGCGGLQNLILGMHIVTGPNPEDSVWLERKKDPILSSETIAEFSRGGCMSNDCAFEDALIHLGAMGIVNGVALKLDDDVGFDVRVVEHAIDIEWLEILGEGKFDKIANKLELGGELEFYELTIDPFDWNNNPAIHNVYFRSPAALTPPVKTSGVALPDALALAILQLSQQSGKIKSVKGGGGPGSSPTFPDIFELYKKLALAGHQQRPQSRNLSWADLHGDEVTGGLPGTLYNASFAIERENLSQVIPLICDAVQDIKGQTFLFTIRFVTEAAGTLAFTRFKECAVIEIDGMSDKIPGYPPSSGDPIKAGTQKLRDALDTNKIPYSMHWAKLGDLDSIKVAADFGPAEDATSPLASWKSTRECLLDEEMRQFFWNQAVADYGLL